MNLIKMENITKTYLMGNEELHALKDISLTIKRNEFVAFTGSSGSGKSTMMNILGALDKPSKGNYVLNNRDTSELSADALAGIRNKEIGFIFQSFHLLPKLSAIENVMQPMIYAGVSRRERIERAERVLDRVALKNRMHHLPKQLSGGQRQRVAIARALVMNPSIILADEPTGNLDSSTSETIMALFEELHNEGQTIVVVTHEMEVSDRCERVIRLQDGSIAQDTMN